MLKEIPTKQNHKIIGFEKYVVSIDWLNTATAYEPIYQRIIPLESIVVVEDQSYYLLSDEIGINSNGKKEKIDNYRIATEEETAIYMQNLTNNGFCIKDGLIKETSKIYWRPSYTIANGFIPKKIDSKNELYQYFSNWNEVYDNEEDCAKWCNKINETLDRNYPTL